VQLLHPERRGRRHPRPDQHKLPGFYVYQPTTKRVRTYPVDQRFEPLFRPARPDVRVTMVPGIGHIGMTVAPEGIAAVRQSFLDLTASAAR